MSEAIFPQDVFQLCFMYNGRFGVVKPFKIGYPEWPFKMDNAMNTI